MEGHRGTGQEPLPTDSELCQAIVVLARAHHDTIWARTKAIQHLRVANLESRAVSTIAPTPAAVPGVSRRALLAAPDTARFRQILS